MIEHFIRLLLLAGCFLYGGAGFFVAVFETMGAARFDPLSWLLVCFPIRVLCWPIVVKYNWLSPE
jgi:hypothetical protein